MIKQNGTADVQKSEGLVCFFCKCLQSLFCCCVSNSKNPTI